MSIRKEIISNVENRFNCQAEYMWEQYPTFAVVRHQSNRKWFALFMTIPKALLGIEDDEGLIDIVNVKVQPYDAEVLAERDGFFPAYHQSKKNWVSISLDGNVSAEEIEDFIQKSYDLTDK